MIKPNQTRWFAALILAVILAGQIYLPVYASPVSQESSSLEAIYQREIEILETQSQRLAQTEDIITRVEDYIAEQQATGVDTAGAELALSTFESAVPRIQEDHDAARTILHTHAGFDPSGSVTDAATALETVRSAGESLRQAHLSYIQAIEDLRATLKDTHTYTGLEKTYQKLIDMQQNQSDLLQEGQDIITRMETFITEQQDLNRETGSLETALDNFKSSYALAEADNFVAGNLLESHAGFDSSGTVTDPDQARITITSAREAQRQFHLTAAQARIDLKNSLQTYLDGFEITQTGN